MEYFAYMLLGLLLTAVFYMGFPLIRLYCNHGKFEKKKARSIALWNSVVVGAVFLLLTYLGGSSSWSYGPAFLYYLINRAILTKKESFINTKIREKEPVEETVEEAPTEETPAEENQTPPSEEE